MIDLDLYGDGPEQARTCCVRVRRGPQYYAPCQNKVAVIYKEEAYCETHAPVGVAEAKEQGNES